MPEYPLARILIRRANIIRARSIVNGSPTPAQCETINRDCKSLEKINNHLSLSLFHSTKKIRLTLIDHQE